jgi:hypothetical protein
MNMTQAKVVNTTSKEMLDWQELHQPPRITDVTTAEIVSPTNVPPLSLRSWAPWHQYTMVLAPASAAQHTLASTILFATPLLGVLPKVTGSPKQGRISTKWSKSKHTMYVVGKACTVWGISTTQNSATIMQATKVHESLISFAAAGACARGRLVPASKHKMCAKKRGNAKLMAPEKP